MIEWLKRLADSWICPLNAMNYAPPKKAKPKIRLGKSNGVIPYDPAIPIHTVQQWADANKPR